MITDNTNIKRELTLLESNKFMHISTQSGSLPAACSTATGLQPKVVGGYGLNRDLSINYEHHDNNLSDQNTFIISDSDDNIDPVVVDPIVDTDAVVVVAEVAVVHSNKSNVDVKVTRVLPKVMMTLIPNTFP